MAEFRIRYEVVFEVDDPTERGARREAFETLGQLLDRTNDTLSVTSMELRECEAISEPVSVTTGPTTEAG